jgi:hypothetical protein
VNLLVRVLRVALALIVEQIIDADDRAVLLVEVILKISVWNVPSSKPREPR